ncbi:MAG: prepilin-type N-terminal cleavage/methylation domain-containing protein [Litoreibacter sp.]|nr:prepilin-type N-terminal cleavage/methylation domain-containing protein [Litoreibacter sp.]
MRRRRAHSTQGYALIEMLVAMAIVVIIGTLAFLAFGNQDQRRLNAEAAEIALHLQTARMRALEAGRPIEIVVASEQGVIDAGGAQLALPDDLRISPQSAELILQPSGGSPGLVLELSRNAARKTVSLDWLTGRVVVQ